MAEENKKNEQNTEDANKESNAKIENEAKPVITNDKMELKYKYREGRLFIMTANAKVIYCSTKEIRRVWKEYVANGTICKK